MADEEAESNTWTKFFEHCALFAVIVTGSIRYVGDGGVI